LRSAINSRSNSASAAKIPKNSRPFAVVVSICAQHWPIFSSRCCDYAIHPPSLPSASSHGHIQPDILHGDMQAQSAPVYGLAFLLGIKLMPRIRNWQDLLLYKLSPRQLDRFMLQTRCE
jgi:hypothetical protein